MSEDVLQNQVKDIISLAIYHDGTEIATNYANMIIERFASSFSKVLLISEDEENLENLNPYQNLLIKSFLKPTNNGSDWLMILEPGEIPSLQLIDNLNDIVVKAPQQTNIIYFPVVICDYMTGEMLEILPPVSRIFRQNPQIEVKEDIEEIILEDFPIIKFKANNLE